MVKQVIQYSELKAGDKVFFYGYDWIVSNLQHETRDGKECVYFNLNLIDHTADIYNLCYNGGNYGGLATLTIARYTKEEKQLAKK